VAITTGNSVASGIDFANTATSLVLLVLPFPPNSGCQSKATSIANRDAFCRGAKTCAAVLVPSSFTTHTLGSDSTTCRLVTNQ
jgi:hypothetical protein